MPDCSLAVFNVEQVTRNRHGITTSARRYVNARGQQQIVMFETVSMGRELYALARGQSK